MKWRLFQVFPREAPERRKVYVFLLCLFLSAMFWLVIQLSREGQGSFAQPISIIDVPEGLFLSRQSHANIRYLVRTTGARMLTSRYFVPTDTFYVNASGLPQMTRDGSSVHYLTRASIAFRVSNQLRPDIELINVWPDTLFVEMVPAMQKKVNVQLLSDISFERRFQQYGPVRLEPDSVWITGPVNIIDTLTTVYTLPVVLEGLNATRQLRVDLQRPEGLEDARLSREYIQVEIPVEEFTESSTEVALRVRCPENSPMARRDMVLFPPRVTVTYLVALRDYGRMDTTAFAAHVVCPEQGRLPERLEVVVDRFPPYVIFQNVRPRSIEYLILK